MNTKIKTAEKLDTVPKKSAVKPKKKNFFQREPVISTILLVNIFFFLVVCVDFSNPITFFLPEPNDLSVLALSKENFINAPWTIFTYSLAHFGVIHIFLNLFTLYILRESQNDSETIASQYLPVSKNNRQLKFLFVYLLSSVVSGAAYLIIPFKANDVSVVGASGAVFGIIGYILFYWRNNYNRKALTIDVGISIVAVLLIPMISWEAHLGGFICGATIGVISNFLDWKKVEKDFLQKRPDPKVSFSPMESYFFNLIKGEIIQGSAKSREEAQYFIDYLDIVYDKTENRNKRLAKIAKNEKMVSFIKEKFIPIIHTEDKYAYSQFIKTQPETIIKENRSSSKMG